MSTDALLMSCSILRDIPVTLVVREEHFGFHTFQSIDQNSLYVHE